MLCPIECEEANEDLTNLDTEKDIELINHNTIRDRPQRQADRMAMKKIQEQLESRTTLFGLASFANRTKL